MRIVGGKDYYDSVQTYGQDTDLVFVRHKDKILEKAPILFPTAYLHLYLSQLGFAQSSVSSIIATPMFIIAAGKLYPCVCLDIGYHPDNQKIYCYSYIELMQVLTSIAKPVDVKYRYDDIRKTKDFFDVKLRSEQISWLVENKITIMVSETITPKEYQWRIDAPILRMLQMQKVVDPFTMHQEISMWVGNLGKPANLTVEIRDDKIKLHKAGFNKFSFRKGKENAKGS